MSWQKLVSAGLLLSLVLLAGPQVRGAESLCDSAYQDCRQILQSLIKGETVRIDVSFWFMVDSSYVPLLQAKLQAGVPVRILMDSRANAPHAGNAQVLALLQQAGLPMRECKTSGILHRKFMLFAGQNVLEFSGANYGSEFKPYKPYVNYIDEAIYFTDDPNVVNSFKTKFDDSWTDTAGFRDYANITAPLARAYPTYPIDPELNFLPTSNSSQSYGNRLMALMNKENAKMDVNMFRITNAAITDTTINAFKRGVGVRFITDKSEYRDASRVWDAYNVDRMFLAGIPIKIPIHQGINHEKVVLLYGQALTVFGSSNWTSPSFNSQQEHNYFTAKPWFHQWFQNQFQYKWDSDYSTNSLIPPEYAAFIPKGPGSPALKAPASGALAQPLSVTLTWDGGPWGIKYDIYFGTSSNPPLLVSDVVVGGPDPGVLEKYTVTGLAAGTKYYWKVVGKTMVNLTAASPTWSFTTGGTAAAGGSAVVQQISPPTGASTGGTAVTISGAGFTPGMTVNFGFAPATKVVVVNSNTITCVTPAHAAGATDVVVMDAAGSRPVLSKGFGFLAPVVSTAPRINLVSPEYGTANGGAMVTITGINFKSGLQVTFGGIPATVNSVSSVAIVVTTPTNGAGPVNVVVTNPDQQSSAVTGGYTFQ
jgi:phosphatidylserine/phosphatidylglycerophosphate/cardiolipin synthase-like enzyme